MPLFLSNLLKCVPDNFQTDEFLPLRSLYKKLDAIFYKGFSEEEIRQFESYQERILANLKEKEA